MKSNLIIIIALLVGHLALPQGKIDVEDLSVQMGVGINAHVKLTDSYFSVHEDAANPLIYGDFDEHKVGIGTGNPTKKLDVAGSVGVSNNLIVEGKVKGDKIHSFSGENWFYGWSYTRTVHTLEPGEVGLLVVGQTPDNWSSYYQSAIVYKTHYGCLVGDLGTSSGESVKIQASGDNLQIKLQTGQNTRLFWTYLRLR